MTFKDHFSSHAADYASYRPTYPAELVDHLASLGATHELAWDVGCGTGQLSVLLARRYTRVHATDASAAQIAKASPHPHVGYATAPADRSGLTAASVDLVTVAQAAHWFDLPGFYAEARRVAKADAVIALISYGVIEADGPLGEVLSRFYQALGPFWPPERAHVENGYRDLPFPFAEIEKPKVAMRARWGARELLGYVSTWSAVRPALERLGADLMERFRQEVTGLMGGREAEVRWPLVVRVGRI